MKKHQLAASSLAGTLLVMILLAACGSVSSTSSPTEVAPSATFSTNLETAAEEPSPSQQESQAPSPTIPTASPTGTAVEATQAERTATLLPSVVDLTNFPDPAGYTWKLIVPGLSNPLDLASPPDGSGRMFILEQPGVIRVFQDGNLLPDPFLDIREKVQAGGNEQGLLGIAFHPDFANNRYFYINYTGLLGIGDTVIVRYQASLNDPNLADVQSEKILLTVTQPYANHNGGGLAFGPDGYLYLGLGDGGSGNDPHGNGQSVDTLLGKILRIDVDGGDPYAIPQDNPFAGGGGVAEIWAYGLRNPWRFSFDRKTGDLYIADVGQNQWEEVDFLAAGSTGGANFGWSYREGSHSFKGEPPAGAGLVDPIFDYQHGTGCSITGGYVYRGRDLPEFSGIYLFSDYCSGIVWGILRGNDDTWQVQELFQTEFAVTSFGLDSNGEIYLMDRSSGSVYRLEKK